MVLGLLQTCCNRRSKHPKIPRPPVGDNQGEAKASISALGGRGDEGTIQGTPHAPAAFLPNAHDMIIQNPIMIAQQLIQVLDASNAAIRILEQHRIPGAEIDSADRRPARCHPSTRMSLRREIISWLTDPHRAQAMFWVLGPAGVGKSAIARTIGEHCKNNGRLGAAFFFSRLGHRDNPLKTIPTIAYQLAARNPLYKRLITERLTTDITIPEKDLRSQFKELIIEPFKVLKEQDALNPEQPLVIIVDGLDECDGDEAQCELIALISECTRVINDLLWIVCSRPEWHFKRMLSRVDFGIECRREDLSIDDEEAQKDVYMFLKDGFEEIRQRYSSVLDAQWPPETHIQSISTRASGLFIFASTILIYVGDRVYGTPDVNLNTCIRLIRNASASAAAHPFRALDLLYHQILSKIPSQFLPTAMRILGLCILFDARHLTVRDICNFLGIDRGSFYSATIALPAILHVPDQSQATGTGIMFYHASFGDFLKDPHRSGNFVLDEPKARVDIAIHLLRWHNFFNNDNCKLEGERTCLAKKPQMCWVPSKDSLASLFELRYFCETNCWDSFRFMEGVGAPPDLLTEIDRFRFFHLKSPVMLLAFVNWLQSNHPTMKPVTTGPGGRFLAKIIPSGSRVPLVRTWTANETDRKLVASVDRNKGIWVDEIPRYPGWRVQVYSPHYISDIHISMQGFILGRDDFACFVGVVLLPVVGEPPISDPAW